MSAAPLAVEGDDQGQANGYLGGGDGNNEEHEDLAIEVVGEPRKGHERQVGGVEHQFERHVDDEQVAPHQHAQQAEREEQPADDQVMFETNRSHFRSFLVSSTTPIIATSSSTETISN